MEIYDGGIPGSPTIHQKNWGARTTFGKTTGLGEVVNTNVSPQKQPSSVKSQPLLWSFRSSSIPI